MRCKLANSQSSAGHLRSGPGQPRGPAIAMRLSRLGRPTLGQHEEGPRGVPRDWLAPTGRQMPSRWPGLRESDYIGDRSMTISKQRSPCRLVGLPPTGSDHGSLRSPIARVANFFKRSEHQADRGAAIAMDRQRRTARSGNAGPSARRLHQRTAPPGSTIMVAMVRPQSGDRAAPRRRR